MSFNELVEELKTLVINLKEEDDAEKVNKVLTSLREVSDTKWKSLVQLRLNKENLDRYDARLKKSEEDLSRLNG